MLVGSFQFFGFDPAYCDQSYCYQHHKPVFNRIETIKFIADKVEINFGTHEKKNQPD